MKAFPVKLYQWVYGADLSARVYLSEEREHSNFNISPHLDLHLFSI